jgi:hypothetical protein
MIWLRTFCQKSNIFGVKRRIGVVKFREVIFGFCVDEGVFEERLIFVGLRGIGWFESSITQNILFLHDFE